METISRDLLTFLINALWQIPIIAGVAVLTCRLMRNSPAAHRHAVWVAALIAALVLPVMSIRTSEPSESLQLSPSFALAAPGRALSTPAPAAMRPAAPAPQRTVPLGYTTAAIFLIAYLVVLLFRLCAWRGPGSERYRSAAVDIEQRFPLRSSLNGAPVLTRFIFETSICCGRQTWPVR